MRNNRFIYALGIVLLLALVVGLILPAIAGSLGVMFGYSEGMTTVLTVVISMAAAAISFFIYHQKDSLLPSYASIALGTFRYLVLMLTALILLEPKLETKTKQLTPPVIAVLHDNSESIVINRDSSFIKGEYPAKLKSFIGKLNSDKVSTHFFAFGQDLGTETNPDSLRYDREGTNISLAMSTVAKRYSTENLAAVVLLTDGIPTAGLNPIYTLTDFQQPVFTVLLGDTTAQKDVRIMEVLYNQIAYLENETPIKVKLMATGYDAAELRVSISGGGKVLGTQNVSVSKERPSTEVDFTVKPSQTGIMQYSITVDPLPGELTTRNNSKAIFINVLETKVKVALFAGYPHPDVGALRACLERDDRYELQEFIHESPTKFYTDPSAFDFKDFDLFVLHNFPFSPADNEVLNKIKIEVDSRKAPLMVFIGQSTNLQTMKNSLGDRLGILPGTMIGTVEEAQINFKEEYKNHSTFTFDDSWIRLMNSAPPIYRNQSEWKAGGDTKVLATARIKNVALDYPIYGLQNHLERKNMVFIGENIWRVRAHSLVEAGSFEAFDNWIYNNIQWLIVREDKRRFKVQPSKQLFTGNEPVLFKGEVYDESYNPMPDVEIKLNLKYPDGKMDELFLNKSGNARYFLELNNLQEGTYSYEAEGEKNGVKVGTDRGQFSIGRSNIEHFNLTADKGLLEQIALRTRGSFNTSRDLDRLADEILKLNNLKPISNITVRRIGFNEYQWIFYLLIAMLAIEWIVRKRYSLS